MNEIKNVLLCGMGAIGSIYADKILNKYPDDFRVLLDEKRLKYYSENHVIFNGKPLNPIYIKPDNKEFKADFIIIATKYNGLTDAIKNIENFISKDTIIMSLLNGVTSENIIAEKYGKEKLVYSYFIGHSAIRNGHNVTQDGVNKIVFGSVDNKENVLKIKNYFDKSEINYEIPDDIIYSMWLKFMLNVSSNQTSAVFKMTFGEMLSNPKCMEFIKNVMLEVQKIALAEGVKNSEKLIDDAFSIIQTMSPTGKTSMLQDIEAGRKTEVDIFAGTIIEYGKKHNIPTPYNLVLKGIIEALT